jgi:hypothetical protein
MPSAPAVSEGVGNMTEAQLIGSLQRQLHKAQIHLRLLEDQWLELQEDIDVLEEVMTSALVALLKSEEATARHQPFHGPLPLPPPLAKKINYEWSGLVKRMSFEDKEAELGLLLTRMQGEPADWRQLYRHIRRKLIELRAFGMPMPADLVEFEHDLEAELAADKEDAERRARLDKVISERSTRS